MLPKNRVSTHPGEILSEDFLKPTGISQAAFARHVGVEPVVISEIVNGKRGLSPEMAMKFGAAFGDGPDIWWNLQCAYEFTAVRERLKREKRLPKIKVMPGFDGSAAVTIGVNPIPEESAVEEDALV